MPIETHHPEMTKGFNLSVFPTTSYFLFFNIDVIVLHG